MRQKKQKLFESSSHHYGENDFCFFWRRFSSLYIHSRFQLQNLGLIMMRLLRHHTKTLPQLLIFLAFYLTASTAKENPHDLLEFRPYQ